MIPVLGIPILVRPELLWKMLDSIDVPVAEIVVIDNGDCIREVPEGTPPFTHVWTGGNLGVAASWNHLIKIRPRLPWWMIAGFDVEFAPGDLARLETHMEEQGGLAMLNGFNAFAFDRQTVRTTGLFDENFSPAYYEDNDYVYRAQLAGVEVASLPAGMKHAVSSTLNSSMELKVANSRTFPLNRAYFKAKWGGMPDRETFTTPFDAGGDIRAWTLDPDRQAGQGWT